MLFTVSYKSHFPAHIQVFAPFRVLYVYEQLCSYKIDQCNSVLFVSTREINKESFLAICGSRGRSMKEVRWGLG